MSDSARPWRDEAHKKLESIRGLSDKHPSFAICREEMHLETAIALEEAVDRLVKEVATLSQSIGGATDRLVTANDTSVRAASTFTNDLVNAIDSLVVASNSNTEVMSGLQRWVIGLTVVYVALTGVIAWATYIAAGHGAASTP